MFQAPSLYVFYGTREVGEGEEVGEGGRGNTSSSVKLPLPYIGLKGHLVSIATGGYHAFSTNSQEVN